MHRNLLVIALSAPVFPRVLPLLHTFHYRVPSSYLPVLQVNHAGSARSTCMWFTRLAINRPILIWMALAAIAVLGGQAYFRLPAELNPKVDIPTLVITTVFPGAGPPEIETQVTKPARGCARNGRLRQECLLKLAGQCIDHQSRLPGWRQPGCCRRRCSEPY